jgi:3-phosphoglycerate kinase
MNIKGVNLMQNKKTIEDLDIRGKRVLVRCDFNVPMDENRNITDDRRIKSALPTIEYILENDGKVVLMSHLGRPKGEPKKEFSLEPVAKRLADLLGREVIFAEDDEVVGESAKKAVSEMEIGDVVLLQNTRFRKEEKKNEEEFAKSLASLGDIFVNDAFGTAHRSHASNVGVSKHLPSAIGYLVKRELDVMAGAISNPERPFLSIL